MASQRILAIGTTNVCDNAATLMGLVAPAQLNCGEVCRVEAHFSGLPLNRSG
jgi:hypothetical protein